MDFPAQSWRSRFLCGSGEEIAQDSNLGRLKPPAAQPLPNGVPPLSAQQMIGIIGTFPSGIWFVSFCRRLLCPTGRGRRDAGGLGVCSRCNLAGLGWLVCLQGA